MNIYGSTNHQLENFGNLLDAADKTMWEYYSLRIIDEFHKKKWALYQTNSDDFKKLLTSNGDLSEKLKEKMNEIVLMGSSEFLMPGEKYILLPEVEHSSNVEEVYDSLSQLYRPPCYMEFKKDSNGTPINLIGIHPIDSIQLTGNFLNIGIAKNVYSYLGMPDPNPNIFEPYFEVPLDNFALEIRCINRFQTLEEHEERIRKKSSNGFH